MSNYVAMKGACLGILGGTFNPIHSAHLAIAEAALAHFELDRVLFVPARVPPHKGEQQVSVTARAEMLKLALMDRPEFNFSSVELDRSGVSYTVDTLRALREIYPAAKLFFVIGDDSLLQLHSWRSIGELMEMCSFITISRPGADVGQLRNHIHFDEQTTEQLLANRIEACNLPLSSTMIREYVREGRSIDHLVPAKVAEYIEQKKLYL